MSRSDQVQRSGTTLAILFISRQGGNLKQQSINFIFPPDTVETKRFQDFPELTGRVGGCLLLRRKLRSSDFHFCLVTYKGAVFCLFLSHLHSTKNIRFKRTVQCVLTNVYARVTTTTINIDNTSVTPEVSEEVAL